MIDNLWKKIKALIYRLACQGDYRNYLRLKARLIRLAVMAGLYERQHLQILSQFVSAGDSVIDVGAHYGVYSRALIKLIGPRGSGFAIEPLPEIFEILKDNLKSFANIECINCAASNESNIFVNISVPSLSEGVPEPALAKINSDCDSTFKTYSVPCKKLDELNPASRVAFIKIDVESHEAAVIAGAQQLIQNDHPIIQVEISKQNFKTASEKNPFGLNGYELAVLNSGQLEGICQAETEGIYYLRPVN